VAAVILENVNAHFPIYGAQQRSLRRALLQRATGGSIEREGRHSERVVVKALNDISLTLHDGDRVGLIGHNGAGKSTLLKLIAGIYEPVSGTIRVEGRVTPLFDALPGLDGEDTGYENIITSGMLIGMTREQIEAKIPEIEEFCELGEYLNLPVRTYSTGMTMRLGFALVTALDPGVLLMDEGFGTGDLRFAERARARMKDFIGRSPIMVLASHSDSTIRAMCNKAIMMEAGRIVASGPVDEVCDRYYESVHEAAHAARAAKVARNASRGAVPTDTGEILVRDANLADRLKRTTGSIRFTAVAARDNSGRPRWEYVHGETANFRFEYEVFEEVPRVAFLFRLLLSDDHASASGLQCITDILETISTTKLEVGHRGAIDLTLPELKLLPNDFRLYVCLISPERTRNHDVLDSNVGLPALAVRSGAINDRRFGAVSLDYQFRATEAQEPVATPSVAPSIVAAGES
jgi:ABC-type polysaccharide/polyol phosphate transport system ATPase subunit